MLKFAVTGNPNKNTSFMEEHATRKRKASIQSLNESCICNGTINQAFTDDIQLGYGASFSMKDMEQRLDESHDSLFDLDEVETVLPTEMWNRSDRLRNNMVMRDHSRKTNSRQARVPIETSGCGGWKRLGGDMEEINSTLPQLQHTVSSSQVQSVTKSKPTNHTYINARQPHTCNSLNNLDFSGMKSTHVEAPTDSYKVLVINNEQSSKRRRLGSVSSAISTKDFRARSRKLSTSAKNITRGKENKPSTSPSTSDKPKKISHLKQIYNRLFGKKKGNRGTPNLHKTVSDLTKIPSQVPDASAWEINPTRDVIFKILKDDYGTTLAC